MKILYTIAGFYRPAGMERILADKANYLAAKGHELLIVTTEQKNRPDVFPLDPSIRRVDLGIGYEDHNGGSFFRKLLQYPHKKREHRKRLKALLFREKPDICISMFCGDERFLPSLPYRGKTVLEVHFSRFKRLQYGRKGLWALADRYRNWQDGKLIRRFDRFVALTHEDLAYWGNPANGLVIPNFVNKMPAEPSPMTGRTVLAVGRLCYQKAFDRLLNAWSKALQQLPAHTPWVLKIVGDGEDRNLLESRSRELGIEEQVQFCGACRDMDSVYREASLMALSSRYEGLPMVLLEAQAYGLPIVSFDCKCGPRDVVTDGVDGILVPQGDTEAMGAALAKLIQDAQLRSAIGARAREHAVRWNKESIMQQWLTLLENI